MEKKAVKTNLKLIESKSLNLLYEISKESVNASNSSADSYKALTLNIMEEVKQNSDMPTMAAIARTVGIWADEELRYYRELFQYCVAHNDIAEVYTGVSREKMELVMLVDDSTKEEVLDYTDFLFELRNKYEEIYDFMVIDYRLKESVQVMYSDLKIVYKR